MLAPLRDGITLHGTVTAATWRRRRG